MLLVTDIFMNPSLPIIKQHQRDHLFQSHAATRWWIYSLFKGLQSSTLQGIAYFESKSYTLRFTRSHSKATCSLLSTQQQRQKNMSAHGTLTESTEGMRGQGCRIQREHPGGGPVREPSPKCTVGFYFMRRYWEWLGAFLAAPRLKNPGWKAVHDLMITNKLL